jgi:hypothetical protein
MLSGHSLSEFNQDLAPLRDVRSAMPWPTMIAIMLI